LKIQVHTEICLALLASASVMLASAQTTNGSLQKTGDKQSTSTAQTNGTKVQRKSGQVAHADFNNVQPSMPNELTLLNQNGTQGSAGGNGTPTSKMKVRQEFGPSQASKKNEVLVPAGPDSQSGKPKTAEAKTQSPK